MTGVHAPAATTRMVRVAAHVHSEWSDDASWPLSRIAATFGRLGYSVILMSEHSRGFSSAKWGEYIDACKMASNGRVTLVPGIEYGDSDDVVHIPVWGRVPFFGEAPHIGALLADVTQGGGTAVWAHPWRRDAWRRFDPDWSQYLSGVEVWNRKYDGIAPNPNSFEISRRGGTPAFVALDFHTRRQLFPLSLTLRLDSVSERQARADPRTVDEAGAGVDQVYSALSTGSFSPRAFGLPLERLTAGPLAGALRGLERTRRIVAHIVHLPGNPRPEPSRQEDYECKRADQSTPGRAVAARLLAVMPRGARRRYGCRSKKADTMNAAMIASTAIAAMVRFGYPDCATGPLGGAMG